MSNSLDPDQTRHFVGLDLGPSFLKRSTDDTRKQRVTRTAKMAPVLNMIRCFLLTANTNKFSSTIAMILQIVKGMERNADKNSKYYFD